MSRTGVDPAQKWLRHEILNLGSKHGCLTCQKAASQMTGRPVDYDHC